MRLITAVIASASASSAVGAAAQTPPPPVPAGYVRVDAPMAERLVRQVMASRPGVTKLGLHATPDGVTDNVIVASDAPAKIGKKSSPADMQHLASGRPFVVRIEKEGIYDLLLPITDRRGGSIGDGFVVMEVPIASVADAPAALAIGRTVRDRMQAAIPSRAALYGP